jgi:hypothetical protein
MENKLDPALLRTPYLSKEILKRRPKSGETGPLKQKRFSSRLSPSDYENVQ